MLYPNLITPREQWLRTRRRKAPAKRFILQRFLDEVGWDYYEENGRGRCVRCRQSPNEHLRRFAMLCPRHL
jgi:hypothetical protein